MEKSLKNIQYYKFCLYGFLKNLRFFDAFFILFLLQKGLPYTQIGILYAIRELCINLFEIPSGIVADTYGRKESLIASFMAYTISFVLFYYAIDFWLFALAFILYGAGDAFRSGTHKGMIMDYLALNNWSKHKINYYGHTRSWSQMGSALSSLIAGVIVFYSGNYQLIFLYAIIPYLINLLLIISYPKELSLQKNKKSKTILGSLRLTFLELLSIIKQPLVIGIMNTAALHTAFLKAVKDYIQPLMLNIVLLTPFLMDIHPDKKSGLIIGILYFFIYLITSRASRMASKVSDNREKGISYTTLMVGLIAGLACGIFYVTQLWWFAFVAFVSIYVIENIRKPILTGFIADHVPNDILASVISVQSLWRTIITSILAVSFGWLADHSGIGQAFIVVSFVLIMATVLFNIKGKKDLKKSLNTKYL